MDYETYYELEREAACDCGITYVEYVNGTRDDEELSEVMGPFDFECPCPDCNPPSF